MGIPGATWVGALYVAIGGAVGCVLRYSVGRLLSLWLPNAPSMVATGTVNVVGAFILGVVVANFPAVQRGHPLVLLLGVGFCGGLTTFSTFAMELADLLHARRYGWVAVYGGGSILLGIASFLLGVAMRGDLAVRD